MENRTIYVGVRCEYLTTPNQKHVPKLNEGLSVNVRQAAMDKGIAQTLKGKKVLVWHTTEEEAKTLLETSYDYGDEGKITFEQPARILFRVDADELTQALKEHNSSFPKRMDSETYKQYKMGLTKVFKNLVQVVDNDKLDKKEKPKKELMNLKVGDWIRTPDKYRYMNKQIISHICRVSKTTDKSYWIEIPYLTDMPGGIACGKYARDNYEGVNGLINETNYQADENWTIPYEQNKERMDFIQIPNPIRIPGKDKMFIERDPQNQGYKHTYRYD